MKTSRHPAASLSTLEHVDPKWEWHHRTLLNLRQNVLRAQTQHSHAAAEAYERDGIDAAEAAQEETEHDVVLAELHVEADRLAEIDAALERMRAGRYGICEETGQPISAARLRALPWTRYSRAAAGRHERRSGG